MAVYSSMAVTPEGVVIIPKLGELGSPDEAFLPVFERLPEHRFAEPWAVFGEDWLLKPCLAKAWGGSEMNRWLVLHEVVPDDAEVKTLITDGSGAVSTISPHLVRLAGRCRWQDLLAAPFTMAPNERKEALSSSYDLVHWIHNQHAFLSGRGDVAEPKGILISVYGSRRMAMEALIAGEIDALDDLLPEERKRIYTTRAQVQLFNRRSNRLLYLLWNPDIPDLGKTETRRWLETFMDKRRIASRVGSRAGWATWCPLPSPVPTAWSPSPCCADSILEEAALPESLVLWTEDTEVAVSAGIEVALDMESNGIKVSRQVAHEDNDPRCQGGPVWSAWIGTYPVSPDRLLPEVPPTCEDPLSQCRPATSLNGIPSISAWGDLSSRLRACLEAERRIVFLCWLPRWGAVSRRWLIPEPGAGSLMSEVTEWLLVRRFERQ
jgi:hypothetical protein